MSELAYEKDNLPTGWAVCKLENVTTNVNSGFASGKHNKSGKGVPHIRPMNIDYFGNIDLSVVKYVKENFKDKLQENDVLFNNTNSPKLLGKTALIKENTNWAYSNHMTRIRANNSRIESSWLAIFLHKLFLDGFYKMIAKNHVNQSSINSMYLTTKIPIIIAPLNEQKRIISKIESIFAQIDAANERLEALISQVKSATGSLNELRRSILKHAFDGNLVRQDSHDESAESLLKRIHKNSKIEFEKANLPKGWAICKLENVTTNVNSGFASGKHNKSGKGVPHIRPMNIDYFGNIDLSVVKYVKENFKDKLQKNDVLFNNTNSPKLLGKTALIKENTNWAYSNHMTRIRANNSIIESSWLAIFLHKLFLDGFYKMIAKNHVNQSSINSMYLTTKIPIIIAPLNEQKRIVSKIESIFGNIDSIEKQVNDAIRSLNTLKQSVLKLAFEGKLVPQDPSDEPASVLLEKIKLQKK